CPRMIGLRRCATIRSADTSVADGSRVDTLPFHNLERLQRLSSAHCRMLRQRALPGPSRTAPGFAAEAAETPLKRWMPPHTDRPGDGPPSWDRRCAAAWSTLPARVPAHPPGSRAADVSSDAKRLHAARRWWRRSV